MKEADLERAANTFEKIARQWHTNRLETWQPSTARDIINRLEKDIFSEIGALPISAITHKQLMDTLRKIEERGANEIAKRLKANCARIFSYAIQHGYTDKNIAADLTDVLKPVRKGHFAAITTDELPNFLKNMERKEARLYILSDSFRQNSMLMLQEYKAGKKRRREISQGQRQSPTYPPQGLKSNILC